MKEREAEGRRREQELRDVVEKDQFLQAWLDEVERFQPTFDADNAKLDAAQREKRAKDCGYRTWRQYLDAVAAANRLSYLYVHGEAFKRLWVALKEYDKSAGWVELYGPHNGGVPSRLMAGVAEWYQAPKFTKAEMARHNRKITKLCDELLLLIGQVTPSLEHGDPFRFAHISDEQADRLLEAFHYPPPPNDDKQELRRSTWKRRRIVQSALEYGGIDAAWCIKNIKIGANQDPATKGMPTKVRAKSAFKTYLILKLNKIIWTPFGSIRGLHQLMADVVAELTDSDCSAEDVRKAITSSDAEDSGLKA